MRSGLSTTTTSIALFVVPAAASTFIDQLPACWQTCIEQRDPQCDSTDLNCLCHSAATPTLLPILLTCVRRTCDTTYYPEFLTAPLQAVKEACGRTQHKISDAAVSKADGAAENAYSDVVGVGRGREGTATRTRVTKSWDMGTTMGSSVSFSASTTGPEMAWSTTGSTLASSSVASVGPTIGVARVSGPSTTSSASPVPIMSTSKAHQSSGDGGTPLDVGQHGTGVKKRAGSLLGLAIFFVVGVWF